MFIFLTSEQFYRSIFNEKPLKNIPFSSRSMVFLCQNMVSFVRTSLSKSQHPTCLPLTRASIDDIGVVSQCLSDTAVQIELDTDDGIRANNFSDSLGQISFTIVITVGDHGTMQAE